ncbi:hypothetical protein ASG49_10185 [Marmoricola sp. Leaf446]|uniref:hypothetical protein n=1 Tax=Marmoricola sp. Leaf446 TaxID=1736379 RepID=UPI0006F6B3AE|nr:hypothetical protein [Marmoricola sp. Leaf446]KQT92286.1 hypothetical protein ASG49_10185 [Marmoricola sp. Leaf446]
MLLPALVLTACSGGSDPGGDPGADASGTPSGSPSAQLPAAALEAGTCWGDQQLPAVLGDDGFADWVEEHADGDAALGESMRDDAAFSEQVDCAEPHALELYATVALPRGLDEQVTSYATLLDQDSPLQAKVRDQVNQRCLAGTAYGRAQQRAGGLPVQLGPALAERSNLHVAWDPFPANLWEEGQRRFVCTFEQDEPGTLRMSDLTTTEVPVAERVCVDVPGKRVPCTTPHEGEEIAEMVLNAAVARGDVNGRRAVREGTDGKFVALSDAEYAKLDRVCQTLFRRVSTGPDGVVAKAYPGAVDQWPTKQGAYVASCFAVDEDDATATRRGTVFDKG